MVAIDINTFAEENWSGYKKSVTELSKSKDASLVENDMELYCFDDVCADLYEQNKKPTSADAFMKKSLTFRLWKNCQEHFGERSRPPVGVYPP